MRKSISDIRVILTSVSVSIFDVALNMTVAFITGSTVMIAQSLQGLSDLLTGVILFIGVRRSKRKADLRYQFGYGREIFFWVLMASILMFMGAGGLSFYFGYHQAMNPQEVHNVYLAFIILLFGLATNAYALSLSVRRIRRSDHSATFWKTLLSSSIVETKATLLIDFMGTVSALLGLMALGVFQITGNVRFDGAGGMAIGLSMMAASLYLIRDVRDLITGRAVDKSVTDKIIGATQTVDGIQAVLDLRTMYLGSARMLVIIEVHVKDGLDTDQIEKIIDNVKLVVTTNIPEVEHIQVEVETPD